MQQASELELSKELLENLDCPKCKLDKGLVWVNQDVLSCPECEQKYTMKRVDGVQNKGLLIPDFFEFEDPA